MKHSQTLKSGLSVDVHVGEAIHGNGTIVTQQTTDDHSVKSTSVTCTCWDAAGKSHSVTKTCPKEGNTCDCSDAANPKITCS